MQAFGRTSRSEVPCGWILTLVHSAGYLLAARFAGADRLPLRLANQHPVPYCWDNAKRRFRVVERDSDAAGACVARSAGDIATVRDSFASDKQ